MSYKLIPTQTFKDEVYQLIKKYPSIKSDLKDLSVILKNNPKAGNALGSNAYKIRIKNSDSGKGKRSGYRIITYVSDPKMVVWLLTIYSKSRKTSITDQELSRIINKADFDNLP
ncbi:hypothetical protein [Desulfonatronovibrio magnus]|uniref:hypothetical protein n=1 Tax=Desulfonatronovibrio magnus TaxID=698827 RepID=UPI0005EB312C|nr:hypothetical protein [Desulfonatronovibrio magnus]